MKIEVGLTPIGRTIVVSLGVTALALAALAAQGIWLAAPPAGPQAMPDDAADAGTFGYVPLYTQAREGSEAILAPAVVEVSQPALFTKDREGSVPVQVGDRSLSFTQAREQWYEVSGSDLARFTQAREASGVTQEIAQVHLPLFVQAREQWRSAGSPGMPLFTQEREG